MTRKQNVLRTAWLGLNKSNSSLSTAQSYSLEMFWKNKAVSTTGNTQTTSSEVQRGWYLREERGDQRAA